MASTSRFGAGSSDGSVADDAVEPGDDLIRGLQLGGQFDKRILDDIWSSRSPLPGEQLQGRGMAVEEAPQRFRGDVVRSVGHG